MLITIPQSLLASAIARGAAVASKNSTLIALTHIRLRAEGERLSVATTDLDRFAEAECEADVQTPGSAVVPADAFTKLIGKHPKAAAVTLEGGDGFLLVKCGRSKVKLPTLPADQFPGWADAPAVAEFAMGGPIFERSCNRVRYAASEEEARYYLQGVFIEADADADALVFVATDGNRLAISAAPLPEGAADMPDVIVPSEGIDAALRVFKGTAEIIVGVTPKAVTFAADNLRLCVKVIDGTFPQYRPVVPQRGQPAATLKRADFVDCLERANVLAGEGAQHGAIVMTPGDGSFSLRATNSWGGEANEELAADVPASFERFGFNPKFAAQFLATLPVDDIVIEQSGPTAPHLIHSPQAPDFTGVLMPMRV